MTGLSAKKEESPRPAPLKSTIKVVPLNRKGPKRGKTMGAIQRGGEMINYKTRKKRSH